MDFSFFLKKNKKNYFIIFGSKSLRERKYNEIKNKK